MGEDPTQFAPEVTEPATPAEVTETVTALIERALSYSPDRARFQAAQESARAQLSAVRADRSPTVEAGVNTGYLLQPGATTSSNQGQGYFVFTLNLRLPLLEGPRIRAEEQNRIAELNLQQLNRQQLEVNIKEQVFITYTAYKANVSKIKAAEESVKAAEEAQRLAQERYMVGKGTQLEVLDALARLTIARDNLAETYNERDIAAQNIRWLTGLDRPMPVPGVSIGK
jgi:outer membrane protein TolC